MDPANASDEDIFRLRTLTSSVSPQQWDKDKPLTLSPIAITSIYWRWWWIWCREFTITGRVVCADGSPVPGAEVNAYDVDYWWWWSSIFQVGSTATTDANGNFTLSFRWCCGWWPWWWWETRYWRLDPILVEKIYPVLQLHPELGIRQPSPTPTLDLVSLKPQASRTTGNLVKPTSAASQTLSPELISNSREKLVGALPYVQEFERLRIWPWYCWYPWFDCAPNIIFKVTQNCGGAQNNVIVDENIFQTRWDIPTNLDVTLTANQSACCIPGNPPPPEGNCILMTEVCQIPVVDIGGNSGAAAGPVGFAYPNDRDRPFSEDCRPVWTIWNDGRGGLLHGPVFSARTGQRGIRFLQPHCRASRSSISTLHSGPTAGSMRHSPRWRASTRAVSTTKALIPARPGDRPQDDPGSATQMLSPASPPPDSSPMELTISRS